MRDKFWRMDWHETNWSLGAS